MQRKHQAHGGRTSSQSRWLGTQWI